MSDEEEVPVTTEGTASSPVKASVPVGALMIAVILAGGISTAGAGGAVYWLVKSGRIPLGNGSRVEAVAKPEPVKTKLMPLDPLLVNLADADGHSYLRVSLTLKVEDPPPDKNAKAKEPEKGAPKNEFDAEERDAALGILGRETGAELLAPDGKERLKRDLAAVLKERVPEVKVVDVLITEFLVQR